MEPNILCDATAGNNVNSWVYATSTAAGTTNAFTVNATPGNATTLGRNKAWTFTLSGSALSNFQGFKIYYQAKTLSATGSPRINVTYSVDGGAAASTFTSELGTYPRNLTTGFSEFILALPASADNPASSISFTFTTTSANTTYYLDNFQVQAVYNSITTGSLSVSSLCPGNSVSVPYTVSGTFLAGNIFKAQLSDASGSFASPVQIGSLTSTASGTISAVIPAGTSPGNGYRIRVVSTTPSLTGGDNGSNLTVNSPVVITTQPVAPAATCSGSGTITVSVAATGTGLSYSWRKGGSVLANGGSISGQGTSVLTVTNPGVSDAGSYDVVVSGPCSSVTSNAVTLTVSRSGYWTGAVSTDWNNPGNWECGELPDGTTDVLISNGRPRYPVLSAGAEGSVKNLTLESSAALTVTGNTLKITGAVNTNSTGSFTASSGSIELNGSSAQTIPGGTFTANTIQNLTLNNTSGATLSGALNVSGIVRPVNGTLNSNGYLTLLSAAGQTALISGNGGGFVTGEVTIQRYLTSAFGYKYISSPFSNATVGQLSSYLSSTATIPQVYRYDENRLSSGSSVTGWTSYTSASNPLNVMEGYAVNFGSSVSSKLISVSGTVNDGNYSATLYNHNRTYSQGFNLVGNPYPSPIDWNAATGWTRTNIDGAIYFFTASGDEYSGVYTSYANGVSGADGDNIIPAFQGFFVHVSSGQSSGTLGMTNNVRIDKPNPTFKSASGDSRKILRFSASFDAAQSLKDPLVLYFDPAATAGFDSESDALKMMNTDPSVPNVYTITPENKQLSICGMPFPSDSLTSIPLGIRTLKDGWVNFTAKSIEQLPSGYSVFLFDTEKNSYNDLKSNGNYRFYLKSGDYTKRFVLILSTSGIPTPPAVKEKLFTISRSGGSYLANIALEPGINGTLYLRTMSGQTIREVAAAGGQTVQIGPVPMNGVYVVTLVSGNRIYSEKTLIRKE